jgi:hypothetical protein
MKATKNYKVKEQIIPQNKNLRESLYPIAQMKYISSKKPHYSFATTFFEGGAVVV